MTVFLLINNVLLEDIYMKRLSLFLLLIAVGLVNAADVTIDNRQIGPLGDVAAQLQGLPADALLSLAPIACSAAAGCIAGKFLENENTSSYVASALIGATSFLTMMATGKMLQQNLFLRREKSAENRPFWDALNASSKMKYTSATSARTFWTANAGLACSAIGAAYAITKLLRS